MGQILPGVPVPESNKIKIQAESHSTAGFLNW